jgi:K+ transporter
MVKLYYQRRKTDKQWLRHNLIFIIGLILCGTILTITLFEKFTEGGWITLLATIILISFCFLIKKHYDSVKNDLKSLEENLPDLKTQTKIPLGKFDKNNKTAVQLVGGYDGFGIHTFFSINKTFPGLYKNIVFVSVAVVDHELFQENEEVPVMIHNKVETLEKYKELANTFGFNAEIKIKTGTDVVESSTEACLELAKEYSDITIFTGKLAFRVHRFYHKLLHNEKSTFIQRNLQEHGITNVILPISVRN